MQHSGLLSSQKSSITDTKMLITVASPAGALPAPPAQERPYPTPTKTGRVPFTIPSTGEVGETYYELWGDLSSSKVPLICLHGGPGVPHQYLLPISLVSTDLGVPVVMYDQLGCGGSTRLPHKKGDTGFWTPELFMAELDNLKSALGIFRFDLLGQSWGGMLAGQYATTQPRGLRKLVLCDSPASMITWVDVANELRAALPPSVQETLDRCERDGLTDSAEYEAAVMVFYRRHVCRLDPFPDEFVRSLEQLKTDNTVYETMNGPSEFYVVGSLKNWDIVERLKDITPETVPGGILLMNGHFDEAQDRAMEPFFTLPRARVKWTQFALSSHLPQLEETERFIKALGDFLQTA